MQLKPFYSQFGEDRILAGIFGNRRQGVCVEVGANDGVTDSTTYHFERLGWQCVLVEPNPQLCMLIRRNRSAVLHECAASNCAGSTTLLVAEGAERAHGVSAISGTPRAREKIEAYGFTARPVSVRTETLDRILEQSGLRGRIDFISIDVEGHELEVLKGMSLSRWSPRIILVEDNSGFQDPGVSDWLGQHGYERFRRTGVNDWFASRSDRRLVNWRSMALYRLKVIRSKVKSRLKTLFARRHGG